MCIFLAFTIKAGNNDITDTFLNTADGGSFEHDSKEGTFTRLSATSIRYLSESKFFVALFAKTNCNC